MQANIYSRHAQSESQESGGSKAASHRPHPARSSAPRGQSLSKQTSKMKSLGCSAKYAIRTNFLPEQDDDADAGEEDDRMRGRRKWVGTRTRTRLMKKGHTAGGQALLTSQGDANTRLKSVETNPQGIQLVALWMPSWPVNLAMSRWAGKHGSTV